LAELRTIQESVARDAKVFVYVLEFTPQQNDSKIQAILEEEAKAFYSGQKSAHAVADLVPNRVTTYLNEWTATEDRASVTIGKANADANTLT